MVEAMERMLELSRDEAGGGNGKRGGKLNGVQRNRQFQQTPKMFDGTGAGKYVMLRRRQVKIETEAWEQAAKEYMELLMDMCEQKLAPNLPYVKSLFLGWFEPFRDKTAAEQEYCRDVGNRSSHGPFFDLLPAEMMAVITMHKLMSLLVTSSGDGGVLVVQAACKIGEAIEQEVRIHRFLEKTRKKSIKEKKSEEMEGVTVTKEQEILRKKVTDLMKKQKMHQVMKLVRGQDDSKPWGHENKAKVWSRLVELLMETAYIQPPVNQSADDPPDIWPAFIHSLRTIAKDQQN